MEAEMAERTSSCRELVSSRWYSSNSETEHASAIIDPGVKSETCQYGPVLSRKYCDPARNQAKLI